MISRSEISSETLWVLLILLGLFAVALILFLLLAPLYSKFKNRNSK